MSLDRAATQRQVTIASAIAVAVLALTSLLLAPRYMSHSVWFDESQTNFIASQTTYSGIAEAARTVRSYPPLFFFAVHESLRFRRDEAGLRIPAAVFGALAIFAVFLLGRELADEVTGVASAFLFLLTPGAFRYFVDGNPYTLLMLASALSTLSLLRATRRDRLGDWLLYGLFALIGLGTHILFVFHLGAQCVAGLYLARSHWPLAPGRPSRRLLAVMALSALPAAVFYLVYLRGGGDVRPIVLSRAFQPKMLVTLAGMYVGPLSLGSLTLLAVWCPLQALGAAALFRDRRRVFWGTAILIALPLAGITVFIGSTLQYVAYRYAIGVFPLACVVAASSVRALPKDVKHWNALIGVVVLVYGAAGVNFLARADSETFGYQDWRSASAYLSGRAVAGDKVLVFPETGLLPLTYYYRAPGVTAVEADQMPGEVLKRLPEAEARNGSVWIVVGSFANDSPLASRFTETGIPLSENAGRLTEALRVRGLTVCGTAHFHRVAISFVQRKACPATPGEPQ